jgi:hypothetical protein
LRDVDGVRPTDRPTDRARSSCEGHDAGIRWRVTHNRLEQDR